jgi:hypothetical protein
MFGLLDAAAFTRDALNTPALLVRSTNVDAPVDDPPLPTDCSLETRLL